MQPTTTAMAIALLAASSAASAQTANPATLYGRIYVTLESVEARGGAPGSNPPLEQRTRVNDQSSYIGVRGSEPLGGGLAATYQLETAFPADNATAAFGNRNSAIGLVGAFGTVILGRWDTPMKATAFRADAFGDLTIGGYTAAMGGSGTEKIQASFNRRDPNVIQYWSPNLSGFEARLSYSANESKTAFVDPRRLGASLTYARGPLYAGAAYDELRDNPFVGGTPLDKQSAGALFGTYAAGPVRFGLLYEDIERDGFTRQRAWLGHVVWVAGRHEFIYQYQQAEGGENEENLAEGSSRAASPKALSLPPPGKPRCTVNEIGYRYTISKRTFLMAQYVVVDNNDSASCNFGSGTLGIDFGQDPRGFAVGIRHLF